MLARLSYTELALISDRILLLLKGNGGTEDDMQEGTN